MMIMMIIFFFIAIAAANSLSTAMMLPIGPLADSSPALSSSSPASPSSPSSSSSPPSSSSPSASSDPPIYVTAASSHRQRRGLGGHGDGDGDGDGERRSMRRRILRSEGSEEEDRVYELPGQPRHSLWMVQYAGYITVNESAGRALFYWLVESTSKKKNQKKKKKKKKKNLAAIQNLKTNLKRKTKSPSSSSSSSLSSPDPPLVLWLNGGPGCSSMGYGAMEELGPFKIHPDAATLYVNPHAWTQAADILFLESPAGVGFSYSNTSHDYTTSGDSRTAQDSLAFLLAWLDRFPRYAGRELYITGESYAGHYVPQLAHLIHRYNSDAKRKRRRTTTTTSGDRSEAAPPLLLNLKGFMVGNAVTDSRSDNRGIIDYYWSHALISDETYAGLVAACVRIESDGCRKWFDRAYRELGNIDLHTIYTPVCLTPDPYQASDEDDDDDVVVDVDDVAVVDSDSSRPSIRERQKRHHRIRPMIRGSYDPCTPNYADAYFNRADVQKAFHANMSGSLKGPWTICNYEILDNWHDRADSVLPIYRELIDAGLRIWIYSGDEDAMVPVSGTRLWIKKLGLKITREWHPWLWQGQVAGWTQVYEGLTFATVRAAGHEVPVLQPERALALFSSFLAGNPLPTA